MKMGSKVFSEGHLLQLPNNIADKLDSPRRIDSALLLQSQQTSKASGGSRKTNILKRKSIIMYDQEGKSYDRYAQSIYNK